MGYRDSGIWHRRAATRMVKLDEWIDKRYRVHSVGLVDTLLRSQSNLIAGEHIVWSGQGPRPISKSKRELLPGNWFDV